MTPDENLKKNENELIKDHLANERTFLAWIRTSLGFMAFGFVVEKFTLFMKQVAVLLTRSHLPLVPPTHLQGYSPLFGIILVAFGALLAIVAFIHYKKVQQEISKGSYCPSLLLNITLTLAIVLIGLFLVTYMYTQTT